MKGQQPLLDDPITAIVGDDKGDWQFQVRRRPQCLNAVHGAAIAKHGHHTAVRVGDLAAQGCRDTPADPAAGIAEIAVAIADG